MEKQTGTLRALTAEEQKAAQEMVESLTWDLMVFLDGRMKKQPRTTLVPEGPFFHAIALGALHHAICVQLPANGADAAIAAVPGLANAIVTRALHRRMQAKHGIAQPGAVAEVEDPYRKCHCGSGRKFRFCHGPRGDAHKSEEPKPEPMNPGMGEVAPSPEVFASELAADEVIAHAEAQGKEPRAEEVGEAVQRAIRLVKG